MLPVQELPHEDAGGTQTKATAGIGVEENGPVVKLLAEHDVGIDYGLLTVFDRRPLPFQLGIARHGATPIAGIKTTCAICVPEKRGDLYHYKNIVAVHCHNEVHR